MAFLKRKGTVSVPSGTSGTTEISLGAPYARVPQFAATAATESASKVQLSDADGTVFYLDAADKDYSPRAVKVIEPDDTATGLNVTNVDQTGAAVAAGQPARKVPIVRSPVTVTWTNVTAADTLTVELFVDTGCDA